MTEVKLRRLSVGDDMVFQNVAEDVFDNPIDAARTAAFLAEDNHKMIVGCAEGVVVAMASAVVMQHPDKRPQLFVNEVAVSPNWQRQGIATRLMEALLAWAQELDCEEAWLATEDDNVPALGLYRSLKPADESPVAHFTFSVP